MNSRLLFLSGAATLAFAANGATTFGPFVFKNESGSDADELVVTFKAGSGVAAPVTVTMEPVGAGGTGTRVDGTHAKVNWTSIVTKGSLIAFAVDGDTGLQVTSAQWRRSNSDVGAAVNAPYADLGKTSATAAKSDGKARTRKNIKDLTADEQKNLVLAFQMLHDPKTAPPIKRPARGDPHDRYEELIALHESAAGNVHFRSWFLPWHRKILFDLENEFRALDPKKFANLAIPYWDWTADDFPSNLADGTADGLLGPTDNSATSGAVKKGPFGSDANLWRTYDPSSTTTTAGRFGEKKHERGVLKRNSGLTLLDPPNPAKTIDIKTAQAQDQRADAIAKQTKYKDFKPKLEAGSRLHGAAHLWAGGVKLDRFGKPDSFSGHMADVPIAVNEPAFWLVHSHVDEIWAEWQCKNGVNKYDADPAAAKSDAKMEQLDVTADDVFNFRKLGYTYEFPSGTDILKRSG